MSDDINIKISATDNATATLRAVQAQLSSFSSAIKGIAGTALAGYGLRELGSFLGDSLKAYGESERAVTMLDRVLKSTGNTIKMTRKEIQSYAEARMAQTVFDDDAIVEAASHLARFRDLSGETFKETLDAAQDLATVMGTDLVSATQMLGRALSDPAEGLSKLARAGVLFTDSQKEQIKTLDLIGDKAGQQKIILEELRRQFGGAAIDDASTASGQIKQLTNAIGELKEVIGQSLTPAVTGLVKYIKSYVSEPNLSAFDDLNKPVGNLSRMTQNEINARYQAQLKILREARQQQVDLQETNDQLNMSFGGMLVGSNFGSMAQLALNQQIAEAEAQLSVLAQALNPATINASPAGHGLLASALNVFQGAGIGLQDQLSGLTQGINIGGVNLPNGFQAGLMNLTNQMLGDWSPFQMGGPQAEAKKQQQLDRSLAATESRFLTRGRGQLSPGEQKLAEIEQKQLTVLERMERAFANIGESVILVEGI